MRKGNLKYYVFMETVLSFQEKSSYLRTEQSVGHSSLGFVSVPGFGHGQVIVCNDGDCTSAGKHSEIHL